MTAPESVPGRTPVTVDSTASRRVFNTLSGLAGLAVVLQGLWAGEFLQYHSAADRAQRANWIQVHARGGEVAIALAVIATLWGLLRLRRLAVKGPARGGGCSRIPWSGRRDAAGRFTQPDAASARTEAERLREQASPAEGDQDGIARGRDEQLP